jgi:metal-sulfur cluster biosynthetic enzyme
VTVDAVLTALGTVRDPELDEPVTALGFVASCTVSEDGAADVHLRLPTYFCAPNFAFLMVADAYEAVSAVPGVRTTTVVLDDHFASAEINAGVAARAGFVASFGALADAELDELRHDFVRKAVLAGTDRVCRPLLAAGRTPDELAALTLGDAPPSADRERLRARRAELGLPSDDASALLVDAVTGDAVGVQALPLHLRRARLTRTGVEANTGICRGMLRDRYATEGVGAVADDDEPGLPLAAAVDGTHLAAVPRQAGGAGAPGARPPRAGGSRSDAARSSSAR